MTEVIARRFPRTRVAGRRQPTVLLVTSRVRPDACHKPRRTTGPVHGHGVGVRTGVTPRHKGGGTARITPLRRLANVRLVAVSLTPHVGDHAGRRAVNGQVATRPSVPRPRACQPSTGTAAAGVAPVATPPVGPVAAGSTATAALVPSFRSAYVASTSLSGSGARGPVRAAAMAVIPCRIAATDGTPRSGGARAARNAT